MKNLIDYISDNITEGFKIGKTKAKKNIEYSFTPKNKIELINIIAEKILKNNFKFDDIDTSNITDMSFLFKSLYGSRATFKTITSLDLSSWDVSNVTNMKFMFDSLYSLEELNISGWTTGSVKNFDYMFEYCENLTNIIGIENLNTSSAISLEGMFKNCKSINELDLSKWDTSSCTNLISMFEDCLELKTIGDISKWDTKKIKAMSWMFYACDKLKNVDGMDKWNVSNVKDMESIFDDCTSLVNIPKWYK